MSTVAAAPGRTFEELLATCAHERPKEMCKVLADEVRRGRVERDEDGIYRLVPAAFDPLTLRALATLDLEDWERDA